MTIPTKDRIRDSAADLFQHQGYALAKYGACE